MHRDLEREPRQIVHAQWTALRLLREGQPQWALRQQARRLSRPLTEDGILEQEVRLGAGETEGGADSFDRVPGH